LPIANAWLAFTTASTDIVRTAPKTEAITTVVFLYIFRREEFRITYLINDAIDKFASIFCNIIRVLPSIITIL
jgi:hypothetical protein